ncbi:hypothetical protein ACA910_021332 [Epithemia clementina (nom. ined.)]
MKSFAIGCLALASSCEAWTLSSSEIQPHRQKDSILARSAHAQLNEPTSSTTLKTRKDFFTTVWQTSLAASTTLATLSGLPSTAAAAEEEVTLPNGVQYRVVKAGDGAKAEIGELAAIRFAAYYNDNKIDDIFETPEPYYTRVGSGGLIKGVEEVLPLMRTGDRWVLTIPAPMAFGKEGRRASAGKPRIPGDATIVFDLEVVGIPGREVELIDLIGDD